MAALKLALVNESLNSNSWNLAAVEIAFSNTMNNLRTLILEKALESLAASVLSPNNTVPCPENVTTGLTLALQSKSLSAYVGLNASFVTPKI